MIHPFVEQMRKELAERKVYLKDALASGSLKTMEQYQFVVGQLRGMEEAMVVADMLLQAYDKE